MPDKTAQKSDPATVFRVDAAGLADANHSRKGPLSVWFCADHADPLACQILHIGSANDPGTPAADVVFDHSRAILIPGLVNAHSHLDLTAIGPRPHEPGDGFVPWVKMVIENRPIAPEDIRAAVALGVEKSLAGGVVAVGDILGAAAGRPTTAGLGALAESPMSGVGFVEYFGIGVRAQPAVSALHDLVHELAAWPAGARIRPGLHPHAPNTVSRSLYAESAEIAARDSLPISTHLAETPEESRFIAEAAGPQRLMLERMGIWDDAECAHIGRGRHPVEHLEEVLGRAPFLVVHVNDAPDSEIERLARVRATVAYCPRASVYFGARDHFGPHRFRAMLDAGVRVCLGTDSIINLDTPDRISPLDDARLLARTTDVAAQTLLAMMTTAGAAALGLDPGRFVFRPGGTIAGIVAVPISETSFGMDPADAVLREQTGPELLFR